MPSDESLVRKYGEVIFYYRTIKLRWCVISRLVKLETKEAKRVLCLYKQNQKGVKNGR